MFCSFVRCGDRASEVSVAGVSAVLQESRSARTDMLPISVFIARVIFKSPPSLSPPDTGGVAADRQQADGGRGGHIFRSMAFPRPPSNLACCYPVSAGDHGFGTYTAFGNCFSLVRYSG